MHVCTSSSFAIDFCSVVLLFSFLSPNVALDYDLPVQASVRLGRKAIPIHFRYDSQWDYCGRTSLGDYDDIERCLRSGSCSLSSYSFYNRISMDASKEIS